MTRSRLALSGVLVAGVAAGIGLDRALLAQQPTITRTIVQRLDDPASSKHEVVMAVVDMPPGASAGRHRHHGREIGYILDGSVVFEHEGRPAVTKGAGEHFEIGLAAVHDAKNITAAPAKVLAIYVVEKGKPLADPVK
jgi:quercetin dioxygenase-like cupin family protein